MCTSAVGYNTQLSTSVCVQLHRRRGDLVSRPVHALGELANDQALPTYFTIVFFRTTESGCYMHLLCISI